jgi:hypothetical protein
MSAREPHPRKQFVETAYKQDKELYEAIDNVRVEIWGDAKIPSNYLTTLRYLVSTDLVVNKLFSYLDNNYKNLFSNDELYHLVIHGEVWLYYAGYAVEETPFSYFIQVGKDISRRDFMQIWQSVIKPKQIESRNRGPNEYKMLYAIKRARVFGDLPKDISKKLENGDLKYYSRKRILIPKEVNELLLKADKINLFNGHDN